MMTKKESDTWEATASTIKTSRCKCDLKPGMTREQLIALAPNSCTMPQFLCPAVDRYLRGTPAPIEKEEDE